MINCYLLLRELFILLKSFIHSPPNTIFKSLLESLKQSGATAEGNVTVEFSSGIDGAELDDFIDKSVDRLSISLVDDFRVEEHFRGQKPFRTD
jgi:hypothetical protein